MSKDIAIPPEVIENVKEQLEHDEKLVWFGMQRKSFLDARSFIPFIIGLMFCSMALFTLFSVPLNSPNGIHPVNFMILFGAVLFGGIGLVLLYIPRMQYKADKKTAYLITDRRAIIFKGGDIKTSEVYTPDKLGNIYRFENRRGYGSVMIPLTRDAITNFQRLNKQRGFLKIENVQEVERLLRQLSRQSGRAGV